MFSTVEDIIQELKEKRRPFILVDSENRENEGDLVLPAQLITKQMMNFIITHCRGIPCVCITDELAEKLGLDIMKRSHESGNCAHFTTTIEARHGITTGISARDRAHTIELLTKNNAQRDNFSTPGHVLPIVINKNGLKERRGHTEGGATFTKLAGFKPITVICEILDEHGDSANQQYLKEFAKFHNLKIGSIEALCNYLATNKLDITF